MTWATRKIGEVCDVVPGFAFKSKDLGHAGVPVVKIGNITDAYTVDLEDAQCLPDELITERHEKFKLRNGDIVIAMTGATAGKVGRIRCSDEQILLLNQRVAKFQPKLVNPLYFWSAISTRRYRDIFYGLGGGAAQPNMSGGQIESVEIPVPPTVVQDKIADILSTYDDLIENNRRRMALLEEAARQLYREWFVRLRFPGHEHVKVVDGVPEGWVRTNLGLLTSSLTKGTTPTSLGKKFVDEGVNFVKVEAVREDGTLADSKFAHVDEATHELLRRSQLAEGDVLFSIAGAIGRSALVPPRILPANTNQALAIIRMEDPAMRLYAFLTVRSPDFQQYSLGRVVQTAQANVSLTALKAAQMLIPTHLVLEAFDALVAPQWALILSLQDQNLALSRARDLLLPRLMSGEIAV